MKKINILLLVILTLQLNAQKDSTNKKQRHYLALEIDPAPCILGGYSFSLKYSPAQFSHWSIMTSVYGSRMPNNLIGKSNYEKGFRDLRIETSTAVFVDYFLRSDRTGLHFGPAAFFYSKSVGEVLSTDRSSFKSVYPNVRVGYVYKPFSRLGFYINPWLNVGREMVVEGSRAMNSKEFAIADFSYILAVHFGYQYTF